MALAPRRFGLSARRMMRPWRMFDWMDDFLVTPSEEQTTTWYPNTEMHQTDSELIVSLEIPGVKKENVDIESTEDFIRVTGERKPMTEQCAEGRVCCTEICYGPFERTIYWPMKVKSGDAKASYHDGMLDIHVPISEEEKARRPKRVTVE
jgi:HSP20 family protein